MSSPHASGDGAPSAEEALREALAERNRLWEELQRRSAAQQEALYWRRRAEELEASAWWRAGEPFRLAGRALREPAKALRAVARRLER